jgi:hypothetical protein
MYRRHFEKYLFLLIGLVAALLTSDVIVAAEED